MITKLEIQNYKCLRDVSVELAPLTVLIGKNDTGKSSLLEALGTLGKLVAGPAVLNGRMSDLIWRGANPREILWTAEIAASPHEGLPEAARYSLRLSQTQARSESLYLGTQQIIETVGNDVRVDDDVSLRVSREGQIALSAVQGVHGFQESKAVTRALSTTTRYRFEPKILAEPWTYPQTDELEERCPTLLADGGALAIVLDYLVGGERSTFDRIESELSKAVPLVKAIKIRPVPGSGGKKSLRFVLGEEGHEIPADLASDGVLLLLAYLTLVHAPSPPAVILLEEPENGIHPRQLQRIAEYLKRLTEPSEGASAVQIIVATHSPYFLDFVPAESVRVFGRRENGETVIAPLLDLPGVKERIASGFSLGEMWFNVGEDKLLEQRCSAGFAPFAEEVRRRCE